MVHKIEGAPGITGGQMPLGETPLPQATIDAIRQWITNGAPNAPAAAAAAAAHFAVQTTAPLDKSVLRTAPASILVSFTADVDASLVNSTTVLLERIDGPQSVVERLMHRACRHASALAAHNAAVLLITPRTALDARSLSGHSARHAAAPPWPI